MHGSIEKVSGMTMAPIGVHVLDINFFSNCLNGLEKRWYTSVSNCDGDFLEK